MTELSRNEPGMIFWFVAGFFLVFNLSGLMIYYQHVTLDPAVIAREFTTAQQLFLEETPVWATSAFALAVNSGILASVILMLRKTWALPIFVFSLVCVLAQNLDTFVLRNGAQVWGTSAVYMPTVIVAIGIVEIWYCQHVKAKGWLS